MTGANSMRFGYQGSFYQEDDTNFTNTNSLSYRLNNGVPNQFTQILRPYTTKGRTALTALFG